MLREQALKVESEESDEYSSFGEYIARLPSASPSLKRDVSTLEEPLRPRKGTPRARATSKEVAQALESTILRLPPDLPAIRERTFLLDREIKWSAEEFNKYWPFIDNFWVCNKPNNPITKLGTKSLYWWCRLYKGEVPSEGHGHRAKKLRKVPLCLIKLKMIKQFSLKHPITLQSVNISLHTDKNSCSTHNHTLDFIDTLKINSYIMNAVGEQVAQGYEVSWVHRILQGVKWSANLKALELAGGVHLDLKAVHNAGAEWKKKHPDERTGGAKDPWPLQWAACLAALKARDDVLSENVTAVRELDGEQAHGCVFAKKSMQKSLLFTRIS